MSGEPKLGSDHLYPKISFFLLVVSFVSGVLASPPDGGRPDYAPSLALTLAPKHAPTLVLGAS